MAQLYDIRPFQSVKKQGQQAGVSAAAAIAAIRECQEHGDTGNHISGEFRLLCWRIRNGYENDPKGVA